MAVSSAWSVPSSAIRQLSATSVDQSRYGCPTSYSATSSSSRIVAPLRKLHIGRHSTSRTDGIHSHVWRQGSAIRASQEASTYQNTRESASPSVSVETSESDSAGKSGNNDDGPKPEAEKSKKSPDSSSSSTSEVQKNDGEDETGASAKPSQKVDASTSTEKDDGGNEVTIPSEPSQKAGAKVSAVGDKAEASPKKAEAKVPAVGDKAEASPKKAGAKVPAVGDKAESSPKKAEAATSTTKSDADKSGSDDKSQRPRPAAKKAPAKSFEATMSEDVVPQLASTLEDEKGLADIDVSFEDNQLKAGFVKDGIPYCFWAFFPDGNLMGARGSALTSYGVPPSTIEPFLVDEKKITAELIVFWVKKRLFVQNLLSIN